MEDFFYENNVKRDHGKMGKVFPVVSIISLVIFLVFFNGVPILFGYNIIYFTGMISFGLCYLEYRLIKNLDVEYQIEITNDRVEMSKVTNKKKIDMLADFSIKECEYIGPVSSDRFEEDLRQSDFSLNCTSKRDWITCNDLWYFYLTQDKTPFIIIFEFDEQMYTVFRRYNPRGTKVING